MRESRTYGSVRGARSNPGPYRDRLESQPVHPAKPPASDDAVNLDSLSIRRSPAKFVPILRVPPVSSDSGVPAVVPGRLERCRILRLKV